MDLFLSVEKERGGRERFGRLNWRWWVLSFIRESKGPDDGDLQMDRALFFFFFFFVSGMAAGILDRIHQVLSTYHDHSNIHGSRSLRVVACQSCCLTPESKYAYD